MNLRNLATVEDEPYLAIRNWRILKASYANTTAPATLHFVGRCVERSTGRVSTAIQLLDMGRQRGRTASGRVYELIGEPGSSREVGDVWLVWAHQNKVARWTEVTHDLHEHTDSGRHALFERGLQREQQ